MGSHMVVQSDKTAGKQGHRFKPGQSGNPHGRPAGSRNKASLLLAELIDNEGEGIVRAMVRAANNGDVSAGRALLDRLVPPRKERSIRFALPPLETASDAPKAIGTIVSAVASGDLTTSEANDLAGLVDKFVRSVEANILEARIAALEKRK